MKTLIADCGATKADWLLSGGRLLRTEGFNLAQTPLPKLRAILDSVAKEVGPDVGEVHFYAAALVDTPPVNLSDWFPHASIHWYSDLIAAAHAALGHREGIAAIVGTGANTCQWNGEKVVKKVPCGGFILGDEGSAAVLGRLFLTDFLKGFVPEEIARAFRARFASDYPTLVSHVYSRPGPARYLGAYAPFLLENYAHPYVKALVDGNFRQLFERTIGQYDALPVGVVGGFGYACRDILQTLGAEYGVTFSAFLPSPINGLKSYYGI